MMAVTYRVGRKMMTETVKASTDDEAIRALVKKGCTFSAIEKIEKR